MDFIISGFLGVNVLNYRTTLKPVMCIITQIDRYVVILV